MRPTIEELEKRFSFHPATEEQLKKYEMLRELAKELAYQIEALCPPSREKSIAHTKLQEALQMANAAIAINS